MNGFSKNRLRFETLESRYLLSASTFLPRDLMTLDDHTFRDSVAADIDADGDQDIIVSNPERTLWFEARNGEYFERPLPAADFQSWALVPTDFDGDGDLDLLVGKSNESDFIDFVLRERRSGVEWFENLDGKGTFAEPKRLGDSSWPTISELHLADIDADGDQDILFGTSGPLGGGSVVWLKNDGSASYSLVPVVGFESIAGLDTDDVDGDGDLDIFVWFTSDFSLTTLAWYERNLDDTFEQHIIHAEFAWSSDVILIDLDEDGDKDILKTGEYSLREEMGLPTGWGERTAWHENLGDFAFAEAMPIMDLSHNLLVANDFDLDGRLDLIANSGSQILFYKGIEGGRFAAAKTVVEEIFVGSLQPQDMDGDGDLDLYYMLGGRGKFGWIENRLEGDVNDDNDVNFDDFLVLANNFGDAVEDWSFGDLDGDGNVLFSDFLILAENFGSTRFG